MKLHFFAPILLLAGCASNSGVVSMGPDTYMVPHQAPTGFSGAGSLKAEALQEANQHSAPPSPESIETLLATTRVEKLLDTMLANIDQVMRQSMAAALQGKQLSPEQQRVIDAAPAKFVQVLREEMTWDKMRPLYVQIYQESFTQEEIDGLIAFYKSPAGVAYVEKMPVVMQKSMSIMQSRMAPMMEKMKAAMQQAIAEAKAAK